MSMSQNNADRLTHELTADRLTTELLDQNIEDRINAEIGRINGRTPDLKNQLNEARIRRQKRMRSELGVSLATKWAC